MKRAPLFKTAPRDHIGLFGMFCGFTLLEMCMVLFIIALLAAASLPAIQSAFIKQAVYNDAHQFSLMVKTAMIQSSEQHRPYAIDLTATTMTLHPVDETPKDADAPPNVDDNMKNLALKDMIISDQLDASNKVLVPDPEKPNAWIVPSATTSWVFQPGELCPMPRIRLTRGASWLEMNFNALTGNVENETACFP